VKFLVSRGHFHGEAFRSTEKVYQKPHQPQRRSTDTRTADKTLMPGFPVLFCLDLPPLFSYFIACADFAEKRIPAISQLSFSWRRSQVAKAEVCKTFIHRFKSDRRLHSFPPCGKAISKIQISDHKYIPSTKLRSLTVLKLTIGI
jgi:hypothetical protein